MQKVAFELSGTLDLSDMARFQYCHALRRSWPIPLVAVLGLAVMLPLSIIALVVTPDSQWREVLTNALPFFALLAIWVFLLGFMPYRNAKKVMVAQKYLREPITYTFTEEGLSGSSSSTSYTLAWDVFKKVRESKSLFLLYHGTNIAIVLPKHFFQNEAQIEDWRQFAATHLESKRIDKPSVVARFL